MKYYAVTEDPNELMHFGIKGMKWGVIRTPEQLGHYQKPKMPKGMKASSKPRSPAYMKASAKLSRAMQYGIAKAQANWKMNNSPIVKQAKAENKAYRKSEKKFEKHLELARQGRLKYKGISDDEVNRITDRLLLERQSRSLSGAEGKRFRTRMAESIGEGIIQGVGQGMATRVGEFVGRGSKLKTQRLINEQNEEFAKIRAQREMDARRRERREEERHQQKVQEQQEERNEQKEYERLANLYGEGFKGRDNSIRGNMLGNTHPYRAKDKLTAAQRAKRIQEMQEVDTRHDYNIRRKYNDSDDASMVKDILRQQRADEVSIYKDQLQAYNDEVKQYRTALAEYNKLDAAKQKQVGKPIPPDSRNRPTYTPMDINRYYADYDRLIDERRKRRGWN